jgi:ADP-ribose pyrophosphatase
MAASEKPMTQTTRSVPAAFEITRRENCFQGFYRLDKLYLRHELFEGGLGKEISRELFVRHDAVCVLPYDAKRDEVVLHRAVSVGVVDKTPTRG